MWYLERISFLRDIILFLSAFEYKMSSSFDPINWFIPYVFKGIFFSRLLGGTICDNSF